MDTGADGHRDFVDRIIEQWQAERRDLDVSPMAVIARMSRLTRFLERGIQDLLDRYGLNEPQFGVLAALRRAGSPYRLSPTELYNSLLISSGAMTNRLERLTAAGLVRRVPDRRDRRSVLVQLTPKGRRVIDEVLAEHTRNEERMLAALSADQRTALADLLRTLLLPFERASGPSSPRPRARAGR